jgi:ATP-dependent protease ClpP protease subunit
LLDRQIFFNDIIDDNLVAFYYQILQWNKEDKDVLVENRKPIKIFINSDGGEVDAVMNFIDMIKLSKTPIITIGMGKCYSSGGLMLIAGHKRYILSNTKFLLHDGSTGAIGNTGKVLDNLEFTQKMEQRLKNYILENLSHGVTVLSGKGGFSGERQSVLMCVVPTKDYFRLKEDIYLIDNEAFIVATDAYEVIGGR